jgi:uncharacterized protein YegL
MESKNLSQGLQSFALPGGGYGYTGTNIDNLASFENTLATGLLDESGSTGPFALQLEACVKEIIRSLRRSPVADKLLYRHVHFGTNLREVHGFKPLNECNDADYDGCYANGGSTDLYGSTTNVLQATTDYSEQQAAKKFVVNGVVFMLTDGCHWVPAESAADKEAKKQEVKKSLAKALTNESLESLMTILIGVNDDPGVQKELEEYAKFAGFTKYIPIGEANEKTLAKIAGYVSQSVVAQSQALGSGGPSQSLTF